MLGGGAGVAIAMLVMSLANIHSFLLGMIAVCVGVVVGGVLGRFVGSIVFHRRGDGSSD
jgi:ABC-type branched-subunit amino acid transport system permease subunit